MRPGRCTAIIAASQAEQQINEALKKYDEQNDDISITYSLVNITPFSADLTVNDLTIIFGDHIERAHKIVVDLGYGDFLNIYFGGTKYGLKNMDYAVITAKTPSYVNRSARQEIKSDSLTIAYQGNVYDGLRNAINQTVFQHHHTIDITTKNTTISLPNISFTKATAKNIRYEGEISSPKINFWTEGTHAVQFDSLIWTPSADFQNRYSFFIKGFGYNADAIPFEYAELNTRPDSSTNQLAVKADLKSELALLSMDGNIKKLQPFTNSQFHGTQLTLSQFSEQFSSMLKNMKGLFNISLPQQDGTISIKLEGTVSDPRIVK
jgi:hypothetical protein